MNDYKTRPDTWLPQSRSDEWGLHLSIVALLDCKEQNEFQYHIGQVLEWLLGIADIKKWTRLSDLWTN